MPRHLDQNDRRLLDLLQAEIPAVVRPFDALAQKLAMDEVQVLARVAALKSGPHPVIRQISAIFDSAALGYHKTLVAARVAEDHLDAAAAVINEHPGVSHNYRRNHDFNLWYTLTIPAETSLGLQKTVQELHRRSGALSTRMFPTIRLYKIGVNFDLSGESATPKFSPSPGTPGEGRGGGRGGGLRATTEARAPLTAADKQNIRILQQDLPITSRPFDVWADEAGISVPTLLEAMARYQRQGVMRRFSAVLHHREAGIAGNAMGIWAVPWELCDAFGALAAAFPQVSHCYQRPTYDDWPYSIFTMIHGADHEKCREVLRQISRQTGIDRYAALFSTRQYKKIRVKYFTPSIAAWEQQLAAQAAQEELAHSA